MDCIKLLSIQKNQCTQGNNVIKKETIRTEERQKHRPGLHIKQGNK